jgi:bifunctional DNase/RNase
MEGEGRPTTGSLERKETHPMIEMEVARLLISEVRAPQVVVLREKRGSRSFPILIAPAEAWAIRRGLQGETFRRPLTHDLLLSVITSMGGQLERIVVCDLRDEEEGSGTFYAKLAIRQDGRLVEVDSRPSDAIALATRTRSPIFVEEHVLEAAANAEELPPEEPGSAEEGEPEQ